MEQMNLYELLYEKYKIDKPIRLIELFAGIGSQAKALKNLKANFEHYKTIEWAIPSILAYSEIHHNELTKYGVNFSENLTKEEIVEYLYEKGISNDYNTPMTLQQIKRMKESKLRQIYNCIQWNNNLVNIQKVKGTDLEIVDKDKYTYIYTYSFPCQDLSLAGKQAGMSRDSGTRSGMLWEVERILEECKSLESLPQVLLMENVPQVIGTNAISDFKDWSTKLESLGYSNYIEVLNAKNYGIPQNRSRCFMVSILGEYNYNFPKPIKLEKKLKDLLEKKVDEKYYLSDKQIKEIVNWKSYEKPLEHIDEDIIGTITTRSGDYTSSMKLVSDNYIGTYLYGKSDKFMLGKSRFKQDKQISDTLTTRPREGVVICENNKFIESDKKEIEHECLRIKSATRKGYLEAEDGDGINISSRMQYHRGTVQKGIAHTLKTKCENGVLVKETKIRRLTPKEFYRLMGFSDEDYENASKVINESMIYHTAGDSIVIPVLEAIFKNLL